MSTDHTKTEQVEAIRRALHTGRLLTPVEALNEFGCFRLAARIWDLKNDPQSPMDIETLRLNANGKKFAGYRLRGSYYNQGTQP